MQLPVDMPPPEMKFAKALLASLLLCASLASAANDGLSAVIARIKPSVLAVGIYQETQNPRFGFRGTGFVVGNGNLLVTNAHVIESLGSTSDESGSVAVHAAGASVHTGVRRAEVIALDRAHDLALLRFEGGPLPALELAAASTAHEGQSVAFIGFPLGSALGLSPVTHRGMVSAITSVALPSPNARQLDARAIKALKDGAFDFLQLDATAYPGNSGGPLFATDTGAVVGVVNMVALKSTRESALSHPSGISYAIPVEHVLNLMSRHALK